MRRLEVTTTITREAVADLKEKVPTPPSPSQPDGFRTTADLEFCTLRDEVEVIYVPAKPDSAQECP